MTSKAKMRRGIALRGYLTASYALPLIATMVLKRRLSQGKEDPDRWREKLGLDLAARPAGPLIWLHAVGLGEVLSVRGLIARMAAANPTCSFLVTSTTRASAQVLARQLPPRTIHQFLPIDAPRYRRRFLDHFKPDLCVWVEQDLWPGFVSDIATRDIPQCIIAARMNAASLARHQKAASLYGDLYAAMAVVTAQNQRTADHLAALGATARVTGSLKPAAPPLTVDEDLLAQMRDQIGDRFVWAVAPAHPEDVDIAKQAHAFLHAERPDALLIIAPRFPDRFDDSTLPRLSQDEMPQASDAIWLCDTLGDLGLVYRLSHAALIGGTFSDIEGHNPWEAAALDNAILHGPRVANFADDFAQLSQAQASICVTDAAEVALALTSGKSDELRANARTCLAAASEATDALASRLVAFVNAP